MTPQQPFDRFKKIHSDGWIEEKAALYFPNLLARGNVLHLKFHNWRPPGLQPAQLKVSVCGKLASAFSVTEDNQINKIYLTGECEPRVVELEVLNPFRASPEDRRMLGTQLVDAYLSSPLSIALVAPLLVLQVTAAVCLLSLLLVAITKELLWRALFLTSLLPSILISKAPAFNLQMISILWVFTICLACGWLLASRFGAINVSEASSKNSPPRITAILSLIIIIGLCLRFYGLAFGIPYDYHPDETQKLLAMMRMVNSHSLDPEYFRHPTLLIYLTYFVNNLFHWFKIESLIPGAGDFYTTGIIAGRFVSAIAGVLSILWVFFIGKRLYGDSCGLIAAGILAVIPLHVTSSRYIKEDALLTSLLLLTVLVLLKAVQDKRSDYLLLSGLLAGATAASKYSGLLSGLIIATTPFLISRKFIPDNKWLRPTFFALLCMPLGFFLCAPYSVFNFATFVKDFLYERDHMLAGHTLAIDAWSQFWMYHFWRSLIPGVSWPIAIIASLGIGILAWRRRSEDLFIIGMILLFYLPAEWVKAKPEPQPERYIFPCLPFVAIAAAQVFGLWQRRIAKSTTVSVALVILAIPLTRSVQLASEVPIDTRDLMQAWVTEHIPAGAKILVDWREYSPRFDNNKYKIEYLPKEVIISSLEIERLRASGFEYLSLSSLFYERYYRQPLVDDNQRQTLREVFETFAVVKQFKPKYGTYGFHNPTLNL